MGCIICDKIREKKAVYIYEDELVVAILPAKPAVPGHIKILPKAHALVLEELPDETVERLMLLASFASAAVFDVIRPQGTNIMMTESDTHLSFDIVPRKENDGLDFSWKPKEGNPADLDSAHSKISDKAFVVGKKDHRKAPEVIEEKRPEPPQAVRPSEPQGESPPQDPREEEINYQIRHLERIP